MKIHNKKSILQKTIIVILMVLLINFIVPTYSHANVNTGGGILLSPVIDFICTIADTFINLLQRCMTGSWGAGVNSASFNLFLVEDDDFWQAGNYDNMKTSEIGERINPDEEFDKGWLGLSNKYHIPVATYSPEQIFANNVAGLDINFLNPNDFGVNENGEPLSAAGQLQETIAGWYVALRNLAIVALLSVLVYVGIRMVISSSAGDKAKYKQMFMDWLIAMCLLFFLHYIMSFAITLTESVTQAIVGDGTDSIVITTEQGSFKTNLLGATRFKTQYINLTDKLIYMFFYIALVAYTFLFTWNYLKRLLMMAFLTIIAPLVAITYPIDKIGDGKAQAFNMWLKEYIFNALLQPFHLIIYMVLVGSVMSLVKTNMLYAIAAMAFILPAEKILRKFFGFEKAGATVGALTGFTAGTLLNKARSSMKSSKNGSKSDTSDNKPVRYQQRHGAQNIDTDNLNDVNTSPNNNDNNDAENGETKDRKNIIDDETKKSGVILPDSEIQRQQQEQAKETKKKQQEQAKKAMEEAAKNTKDEENKSGLRNLARAHLPNKSTIINGAKSLGKGAIRTTFKAATGTYGAIIGAAVGTASGQGLTGVIAGGTAGYAMTSKIGEKVGDTIINAPNAIRNEIDIYNGNTDRTDRAEFNKWRNNKDNQQYVRDMMTKESGGTIPSDKELRERMDEMRQYVNAGVTDIKDILKAQKAEEYVGREQSAMIAAIVKERGINGETLSDEKKATALLKNLTQEFENKKGLSHDDAEKIADRTMNVMKLQQGVAHNLQKK